MTEEKKPDCFNTGVSDYDCSVNCKWWLNGCDREEPREEEVRRTRPWIPLAFIDLNFPCEECEDRFDCNRLCHSLIQWIQGEGNEKIKEALEKAGRVEEALSFCERLIEEMKIRRGSASSTWGFNLALDCLERIRQILSKKEEE